MKFRLHAVPVIRTCAKTNFHLAFVAFSSDAGTLRLALNEPYNRRAVTPDPSDSPKSPVGSIVGGALCRDHATPKPAATNFTSFSLPTNSALRHAKT
jgi:hypothetical protein